MKKILLVLVLALSLAGSALAAQVGDGGGTGVLNGSICNSSHSGWTTYWLGHYYVCAWTHSSNYTGWSWIYVG